MLLYIQCISCKKALFKRLILAYVQISIVLVGLVVLFKKQITDLVNSVLSKMTNQANKI